MTEAEAPDVSPLTAELDSIAVEIASSGTAVREFSPDQVVELARAAVAERGKSDSVRDLSASIGQTDDGEPLLHVGITLTNPVRVLGSNFSADLENVEPSRRGVTSDPSEERVRIRGRIQRAAAGAVLGGDVNELFIGEVRKSLPDTQVAGVGLRVTPGGLRVTIKGQ